MIRKMFKFLSYLVIGFFAFLTLVFCVYGFTGDFKYVQATLFAISSAIIYLSTYDIIEAENEISRKDKEIRRLKREIDNLKSLLSQSNKYSLRK